MALERVMTRGGACRKFLVLKLPQVWASSFEITTNPIALHKVIERAFIRYVHMSVVREPDSHALSLASAQSHAYYASSSRRVSKVGPLLDYIIHCFRHNSFAATNIKLEKRNIPVSLRHRIVSAAHSDSPPRQIL